MTTFTKAEATARAKRAVHERADLRADIDYARTFAVDDDLAAEMLAALAFIIDQSHDTIEEN